MGHPNSILLYQCNRGQDRPYLFLEPSEKRSIVQYRDGKRVAIIVFVRPSQRWKLMFLCVRTEDRGKEIEDLYHLGI